MNLKVIQKNLIRKNGKKVVKNRKMGLKEEVKYKINITNRKRIVIIYKKLKMIINNIYKKNKIKI